MNWPVAYRSQRAVDQANQGFRGSQLLRDAVSQTELRRAITVREATRGPWQAEPGQGFLRDQSQQALRDALRPQRQKMNDLLTAAARFRNPLAALDALRQIAEQAFQKPDQAPVTPTDNFTFDGWSLVCGAENSGSAKGAEAACGAEFVISVQDHSNEVGRPVPWYKESNSSWNIVWFSGVVPHPLDADFLKMTIGGWNRKFQFPQAESGAARQSGPTEGERGTEYDPEEEETPDETPVNDGAQAEVAPETMRPLTWTANFNGLPYYLWNQRRDSWSRQTGQERRAQPGRSTTTFNPPRPQTRDLVITAGGSGSRGHREPPSHEFARTPGKEIKVKSVLAYQVFSKVFSAITETDDAVNCLFANIPKKERNASWLKYAKQDRANGQRPSPANFMHRKMQIVYDHAKSIDMNGAVMCLIKEHLQDKLVGKSRRALGDAKQKYVGNRMGSGVTRIGADERRAPRDRDERRGGSGGER